MLKSPIALYGLGFFALAASGIVWAAVPISTIQRWQEAAPEVVSFTVLSVDQAISTRPYAELGREGEVATFNVSVNARIDLVHRTASGLAAGTTIVIRYSARRYKPVSPPDGNYGIILDIRQKVKAYLKKKAENEYELACDVGCLETL